VGPASRHVAPRPSASPVVDGRGLSAHPWPRTSRSGQGWVSKCTSAQQEERTSE
jgi:hypothetical protein